MNSFEIRVTSDLLRPSVIGSRGEGIAMVKGDARAHTIVCDVVRGGLPEDLSGCSAAVFAQCGTSKYQLNSATISGNTVRASIDEGIYTNANGLVYFVVKITHIVSGITMTAAIIAAMVEKVLSDGAPLVPTASAWNDATISQYLTQMRQDVDTFDAFKADVNERIRLIDIKYKDNYTSYIDPSLFSETGYYWSAAGTKSKTTDKAWRAYPAIHVYPGTYSYSNVNTTSFSFVKFPNGTSEKLGASPRTFTTEADIYISTYNHTTDSTFVGAGLSVNFLQVADNMSGAFDFDTLTKGESYRYVEINANTQHAPIASGSGLLFVLRKSSPIFQFFFNWNGKAFIRYKTSSWTTWMNYTDSAITTAVANIPCVKSSTAGVSDFNNAAANTFVYCYASAAANAPVAKPYGMLVTYAIGSIYSQSFTDWRSGKTYTRLKDNVGTWFDWHASDGEQLIEVREGDDLYAKLHGMSANTHAIVYGGTYDISSHLTDSYTFDIDVKEGCWIEGRGMPVIVCESASKLTYASVFRFKQTSGKISGLKIKAKNLRYAIHDDAGGTDIVPFTHTVENCVIEYQGSAGSGMNVGRAIGAGMSNCGEHIYDGCVITDTNTYGADFHTNSCTIASTPSQPLRPAKVTVKNCMFKNCTMSFTSLSGDTGNKRDLCEAYNNSTVGAIEVLGTNAIDLVAWNNTVR